MPDQVAMYVHMKCLMGSGAVYDALRYVPVCHFPERLESLSRYNDLQRYVKMLLPTITNSRHESLRRWHGIDRNISEQLVNSTPWRVSISSAIDPKTKPQLRENKRKN